MGDTKEDLSSGPLSDLKVLDLAGPIGVYCAKLMADLGADVVRIEPPNGDGMREIGPFFDDAPSPEKSLYWWHFNTSKRGLTLDLEHPEGQEIFRRLVKWADIGIESFPPGYLHSLGLDFHNLHGINSEFILTSITPFGQSGPYSQFNGPDIVGQAMSGVMQTVGIPEKPPYVIGSELGYWTASTFAANASMLALAYRDLNGLGQHVDTAMQRAMSLGAGNSMSTYDTLGHVLNRGELFARGRGGVRTLFRCKDGYVFYIAAAPGTTMEATKELLTEHDLGEEFDLIWLAPTILRQEGAEKARFETLMEGFFLRFTRLELLDMGFNREHQVFSVPVGTPKDIVESPQMAARGFIIDVEHPELGQIVRYPGAPYRMPASPWRLSRRAPLIGEHNDEVYKDILELTSDEVSDLKMTGGI